MANIRALSICSLLLSALVLPNALAAEYTLIPSPQTVHVGHFSAALKPVLTINSGDIVIIETVSGPDPEEVDASGVVPPSAVPEYVRTIRREVTDRGPGGHILTGLRFQVTCLSSAFSRSISPSPMASTPGALPHPRHDPKGDFHFAVGETAKRSNDR
jgi:hypothetical protein